MRKDRRKKADGGLPGGRVAVDPRCADRAWASQAPTSAWTHSPAHRVSSSHTASSPSRGSVCSSVPDSRSASGSSARAAIRRASRTAPSCSAAAAASRRAPPGRNVVGVRVVDGPRRGGGEQLGEALPLRELHPVANAVGQVLEPGVLPPVEPGLPRAAAAAPMSVPLARRPSFHRRSAHRPHSTSDDALDQFRHIARERAFGRHVASDRLIQAGLDALIAGVESPSLAMPAGLLRSEEPEAPELFDQVLEELGLLFHPPADPRAAKWAMACWIAGPIADGSLDPAAGTHLIWADIAYDLGCPDEPAPRGMQPRRGSNPGFVPSSDVTAGLATAMRAVFRCVMARNTCAVVYLVRSVGLSSRVSFCGLDVA